MDIEDEDVLRARALGGVLKAVRAHKGMTAEDLAELAHISPVTLRRMERGEPVRVGSYAAIERVFHLHAGALAEALGDDERMVDLARQFGVDTTEVAEGTPSGVWVARFAGATNRITAATRYPSARPQGEATTVRVQELMARLASQRNRSDAAEAALQALLRLLPELAA